MIPKIIHYVWVGNSPKTELVLKCIESWKKYCPDYEIIEWNNDSLKEIDNLYVKQAFECKKWAFVSDYLRLYALKKFGGFYFDTDLEITQNIDEFLNNRFVSGYENWRGYYSPITALMGAEKDNKIISDLLGEYDNLRFVDEFGVMDLTPNTKKITDYFEKNYNLKPPYNSDKKVDLGIDGVIFPSNYFCTPQKDKINYSIHHFNGSWWDEDEEKDSFFKKIFSIKKSNDKKTRIVRILGLKISYKIKKEEKWVFKQKGECVKVATNSKIYSPEKMSIGSNVLIGNNAIIEAMGGVTIGNNVVFGPEVMIWSANHNYYSPETLPYDKKINLKEVKIKDNVWIGARAIIAPGITIEEGAVIAMGAVVVKDVPKCAVVGGNPAEILKYRDIEKYEQLKKDRLFYKFVK